MLDNWQRIEKIVKWAGLSINSFALNIGLNRGENLYQIKKGNNGISKDLAELITTRYPEISKGWILTGEGDMFLENRKNSEGIPFYEIDIMQMLSNPQGLMPSCNLYLPMFKDCNFAALSFSQAMTPDIPQGSIIFAKEIDLNSLVPGSDCLVVSKKIMAIRRVRRELESKNIRLVAANKEEFDDIFIDPDDIKQLYLIKGVIINKVY